MPTRLIDLPIQGMDDRDALEIKPDRASLVRNIRTVRDRIQRGPGAIEYAPTPIPSGSTSGFGVKVGWFNAAGVTGAQTITHNLGTTPRALMLFTTRQNAVLPAGGFHQNVRLSMGMTDGTTTRCSTAASFVTTSLLGQSQAWRRWGTDILCTLDNAGTVINRATFTSFNSSTFTINWATVGVSGTSGGQFAIGYIIFGGAGVAASVTEWAATQAAGLQSVAHGLGGTPQLAIHMTTMQDVNGVAAHAVHGYGVMQGSGTDQQWTVGWTNDSGVRPSRAYRQNLSTSAIVTELTGQGSPVDDFRAGFSSWDATNFVMNKTNAPGPGPGSGNPLVATLCLRGLTNVKVGNFVQSSESAPVNQSVTGVGFLPASVMFATAWDDPGTFFAQSGKNNIRMGYGAMDGDFEWTHFVGIDNNSSDNTAGNASHGNRVLADYSTFNDGVIKSNARRFSLDDDGFTIQWLLNQTPPQGHATHYYVAFGVTATVISEAGPARNYFQGHFNPAVSPEQATLLTERSFWVYNTSTSVFDPTAEAYGADPNPRWSVVNTQDIMAWTRLGVNIRQYDGSSFSSLITTGTNHSAKFLLAFNDRIVSGYTNIAGTVNPLQIRWCANGLVNDWSALGSGSLLVAETNNQPLTGGFVLGERAYLTKARETIELIATGTISPVFRLETRVFGTGMLATHSWAAAEFSAFFLGPDDIYEFDGARMKSLGTPIYKTLLPFIDYQTIGDQAQGAILLADSEYWLLIEPYVFIWDFRRERWFWDEYENVKALGIFSVGTILTTDVDQSQFMVAGMQDGRTLRFTPTVQSFDGLLIDSYVVTRDYYAQEFTVTDQRVTVIDSLLKMNSLYAFRFNGTPNTDFEVGMSRDRGVTWTVTTVTANPDGLAIAYFTEPFQVVRFRVRSIGTNSFEVYGPMAYDYHTSGLSLPPEAAETSVTDDQSV